MKSLMLVLAVVLGVCASVSHDAVMQDGDFIVPKGAFVLLEPVNQDRLFGTKNPRQGTEPEFIFGNKHSAWPPPRTTAGVTPLHARDSGGHLVSAKFGTAFTVDYGQVRNIRELWIYNMLGKLGWKTVVVEASADDVLPVKAKFSPVPVSPLEFAEGVNGLPGIKRSEVLNVDIKARHLRFTPKSNQGETGTGATIAHILVFATSTRPQRKQPSGQHLYVASKGVVTFEINEKTGTLTRKFWLPVSTGAMTFSPDASFVYVSGSGVQTLKRWSDGSLSLVGSAQKVGGDYIRTDRSGHFLLASQWGGGSATVHRIVEGICTSELLDLRKTAAHAHCIELDPSGRFVFVPHTSPKKVFQFCLNAKTGKLVPNDPPFAQARHHPRHYAHHPKLNIAYTCNEDGGSITAWKFNQEKGTLEWFQNLRTLPPDAKGRWYGADIHITPNGRFAYMSNRDGNNPAKGKGRDTLAGVALDPKTGEMKLIGFFPTAHFPRTFCIDLTGRFVYSASNKSPTLFAYRIDQTTGKLTHFATYDTGGATSWVMCGKVGD